MKKLGSIYFVSYSHFSYYMYIYMHKIINNITEILTAQEGNVHVGNCYPEKTNVDRGEAEVDIGFRGLTIIKR